ncbi:hypothetical protein ACFL6S_33500 [Candidatus Poribacteria bacterium]
MKQFSVTTSMGKRLIGKAMVGHPDIKGALEKGVLAIIAGTTNGYVAEEILKSLGQAEGFSREGFRRGMTVAPGAEVSRAKLQGDVIIADWKWQKGKTIFDVEDDLKAGDVVLKGANAFDAHGRPAVQIGNTKGGTVFAALVAAVGRRVRLIMPVGLEKRVLEDVHVLAKRCNAPDAEGPRLLPVPGEIFTELDAIKLLTGADTCLIAAGGVYGAEGSYWFGVTGTEDQIQAAADLIKSIAHEPPCTA